MTDRLITADASKVSGREFMDAVFGTTPEQRAEREERGRRFAERLEAKQRLELLGMRERIAAMVSQEAAERMREKWAAEDAEQDLQDGIVRDLIFTMGRVAR